MRLQCCSRMCETLSTSLGWIVHSEGAQLSVESTGPNQLEEE